MKRLWKTKLPAFLLAMVMVIGMIPAAAAAKTDVNYDVDADDEVELSRSDFRDLYNDYASSSSSSFSYLVFTDYSDLEDYGYFTATNKSGRTVSLDEDNMKDVWFYYTSSEISSSSDCQLSGLTFVADRNAPDGTMSLKFRLVGTKSSDYVDGTLKIAVDGDSKSSTSSTISYEVKPGSIVNFSRSDFNKLFQKKYSGDVYRVVFDRPDSDSFDEGTLSCGSTQFSYRYLEDATFYYDSRYVTTADEYTLDSLSFKADSDFEDTVKLPFTAYGTSSSRYVTGTVEITASGKSGSKSADIIWEVDPDDDISFNKRDFRDLFEEEYSNFYRLEFTACEGLDDCGKLYVYDYSKKDDVRIRESALDDYYFYYNSSDDEDYQISDLTFYADDNADGEVVELDFTLYGETRSQTVKGTLRIEIGDVKSTSSSKTGDINYVAKPEEEAVFDPDDFNAFFQKSYSGDILYVRFTDSENLKNSSGKLYYRYDTRKEEVFSASDLDDYYFYYDEDDIPDNDDYCYPLEDLSFVASDSFSGTVTLKFVAYKSSSKKVTGTLVISSKSTDTSAISTSSVRYYATGSNAVQINANDIARAYAKQYPGGTLQSVDILSVPAAGSLYYDYYGSGKTLLTSQNCKSQSFYRSPSAVQLDLNRLTYIPSGSNYCGYILYTAKGTSGSVLGTILISVTKSAVSEVYGVTPKNTAVTMPASSLYSVVYSATGTALASIQLLELPAASVGTVTISDGYLSTKANTSIKYTYSGTSNSMSQLKFIPATNYTGSVEIPYLAYDANGTAIAVGKFCLGVVSSRKTFSDISSSTWCYKYVTELSDAKVIDGYTDGTFKEKNAITYGAALKLIMLAAGYPEQAKTGTHVFSGYLSRAQADGLVSGNVDLSKPITRLQVSQLAAKSLKLDIYNLSSVKPFTDTTDPYVQALNAAGIVEGYFANGTSTFKPNNTLTRGQVSAIVWRMRNYNK
ncbi:S-layer homology domain-containing protein [Oscillibacter sp.]|uniref:S-layer homology domain-containing protein n=1 Tax=Oscillibacter sp. TaxID=1945593 RepID=UPI001B5F441B|nr:S-layer homology domain-containing protein [Oscillibacter sp.]MBP3508870.1 S-layer homology domain-containing protein [Oscillibacter sp.]